MSCEEVKHHIEKPSIVLIGSNKAGWANVWCGEANPVSVPVADLLTEELSLIIPTSALEYYLSDGTFHLLVQLEL